MDSIVINNTNFHQWIIGKYRRLSNRVAGFPSLYFLRPFRPVTTMTQKNFILHPIQIILPTLVLKSQVVLREMIQRETLTPKEVPFCGMNLISTIVRPQWIMSIIDSRQNQSKAKPASIAWNSRQHPSLLAMHDNLVVTNAITYQPIWRMEAIKHIQTKIQLDNADNNFPIHKTQRFMGAGLFHSQYREMPLVVSLSNHAEHILSDRLRVNGLKRFAKGFEKNETILLIGMRYLKSPTVTLANLKAVSSLIGYAEESITIPNAQQGTKFYYLLPPSITRPKMVSQQVGQNEGSAFVEQSIRNIQSLPTTSQTPGIDINRLTDQVYQALERKIRLEKQRRGYR